MESVPSEGLADHRLLVWIIATVASAEFLFEAIVSLAHWRLGDFAIWMLGAPLVFVLAVFGERIKAAGGGWP